MKLYGLFGKGSGKLGSSVFAISSGEQIVREYNPVVENPNTPAQVQQRAKFKLLSQLAVCLASIIVIAKQGLVSARNRFIGLNVGKATYADGTASIEVPSLDITGGSLAFPPVLLLEGAGDTTSLRLQGSAPAGVDTVVYIMVEQTIDKKLKVGDSYIVTEPGAGRDFRVEDPNTPASGFIFAYGIVGDVAAAIASYKDYDSDPAGVIASLIAQRSVKAAQLAFTKNSVTSIA